MTKIAILCKAGFSTGMGHVYRQVRLGKLLRSRGMDVMFYILDHPPSIELLQREKFFPKIVAKEEGLPGEMDTFRDLAILDIQDTKKEFIGALRKHSRKAPINSFSDREILKRVNANEQPRRKQTGYPTKVII